MTTPSDSELRSLLDGRLDRDAQEALEERLERDSLLRTRLESLAGERDFHENFNPAAERPEEASPISGLVDHLKNEGLAAAEPLLAGASLTPDVLQPCDTPGSNKRLGGYEIEEVIATGGMGVIYRARDPDLRRSVAVKLLSPVLASSAESRVRFLREAAGMAAIDHPNILPIYAIEKDARAPFIVMRLVEGQSLEERLAAAAGKPLPLPELLDIAAGAASGLAAAHAAGLIHRDVKPSNILLEEAGASGLGRQVFLSDFGLARATEDPGLTRTGTFLGTPQYMSPEQATGGTDLDQRSDLFSLGAVLYTMATGSPPFEGRNFNTLVQTIQETAPVDPRKRNDQVPGWLANLIVRLLAKNPRDRPKSAAEVAETIAKETNLGTISLKLLHGRRTRLRRNLIRAGLATAAALALSAAAFVATEHSGRTAIVNAFLCGRSGESLYLQGQWGTYPGLEEAVAAAGPGDVVLIRSNETLNLPRAIVIPEGKPLSIRAVDGFAPDFYAPQDVTDSFIVTKSALLLDGLIFRKVAPKTRMTAPMIVCESAPLTILNCRFARPELGAKLEAPASSKAIVQLRNCPQFDLLNSEVYGRHGYAIHADYRGSLAKAFLRIQNSQVRAGLLTLEVSGPTALDVSLARSTVMSEQTIAIDFGDPSAPTTFHAERNFVQTRFSLLETNLRSREELRRHLRWKGRNNLYLARIGFLRLTPKEELTLPDYAAPDLDAWRKLWGPGDVEAGSLHSVEQSAPPVGAIFKKLSAPVPIPVPAEGFDSPPVAGPDRATLGPGPGRDAFRRLAPSPGARAL